MKHSMVCMQETRLAYYISGICMRMSLFIGIIFLTTAHSTLYSSILTLTIQPYPRKHITVRRLKTTSGIDHAKLSKMVNPSQVAGIFATYAGFIESSDSFGQIVFPRKQTNTTLYVLVTNRITPIVMFEQTIAHWERVPDAPSRMYTYSRITDPETNLTYWDVQEAPLSTDSIIPLETLIIIAHPNNIFIPTGITITQEGPNLVLPTIYARKGIDIINDSLYVLNLAHLFGQVHLAHTKKASYYASQPTD
jgi:hypothetical protein